MLDFDQPCQVTTCFYTTVVHEDGLYRIYYRGHSLTRSAAPSLLEPGETTGPRTARSHLLLREPRHLNWDRRFPQAFIQTGREKRNWYNRINMTATGVVSTGDDEISLYVLRHYKFPTIHMDRVHRPKDPGCAQ